MSLEILPGPRSTTSLRSRGAPLASTAMQRASLARLDLSRTNHGGDFERAVASAGFPGLTPEKIEVFQINVGKLCNMTCRHCHVDAGPDRTEEVMDRETVDLCLAALDRTAAPTVDITGGAPELNPHFRYLVDQCVSRGKHVMDRCNLTVLLVPRCEDLPGWFAERGVEIVCSLPHYRRLNTDLQRGNGTYEKSIEALRRLNAVGYGTGDPRLRLTLVSNPVGAYLAGEDGLRSNHGVSFDRLIVLNNMPISRFLEWLETSGNLQAYMEMLVNAYNPATVRGLMCRNTLSVGWDGRIYDCDFNQMLDMPSRYVDGEPATLGNFDAERLSARTIETARHCFGCTAGSGSSCGGSLA
jgi:radical SAM/Cys-rich protein